MSRPSTPSRLIALALVVLLAGCAVAPGLRSTTYPVADGQRELIVCRPEGAGPFPAVVFNHGSIVDGLGVGGAAKRGYRLDRVCEALAREGYLVFAPIREGSPRGPRYQTYQPAYVDVVARAIDHVKALPEVDRSRIALMGFSMGGLVSVKASFDRRDLAAIVLLAPAAGLGEMRNTVPEVDRVHAPVLLMIEASDSPAIRDGVQRLADALAERGKDVRLIRYEGGGGHELFYDVAPTWWGDARAYLAARLGPRAPR